MASSISPKRTFNDTTTYVTLHPITPTEAMLAEPVRVEMEAAKHFLGIITSVLGDSVLRDNNPIPVRDSAGEILGEANMDNVYATLKRLATWIEYHHQHPSILNVEKVERDAKLKKYDWSRLWISDWDKEFFEKLTGDELVSLCAISNHLSVIPLVDLVMETICNRYIRDKTPEEIAACIPKGILPV